MYDGSTIMLLLTPLIACCLVASGQEPSLSRLDGEWMYVEDRTEGRELEQMGPPMSGKFSFRTEQNAIILESGHGSGLGNVKVLLDGTATEVVDKVTGSTVRYRAEWKPGCLTTFTNFVRKPDTPPQGLIRREFQVETGGLLVRVITQNNPTGSLGFYQHPEDILMPKPAPAKINELGWLSGNWVATRSSGSSVEERWSSPKGGSLIGTSRSINTNGKLTAFEFLRILEREQSLVYIAQPGGTQPTEFLLTELSPTKAVFENPRHDYPKKITYELTSQDKLTATIGFLKGGTPRRFEFIRE